MIPQYGPFIMTTLAATDASGTDQGSVLIRIGDITLSLSPADTRMKIHLDGDMSLFSVPSGKPDLSIKATYGDLSGRHDTEMLFDSGGAWRLYDGQNHYWFHCLAAQFGGIPYKVACLNRDFTSAEVRLHQAFFDASQPVYPLQYPLDEVLILNLLSRGRGVEMHGCGTVDSSGDGLLFCGQSGAGKTTMARIWKKEGNASILSDDRIILRQGQEMVWMYGTPWHGEEELASPAKAPLKALFFLRHGSKNRLRSKTGAEAAAMLFSRSFPVFYRPEGLEFTLEFFHQLTGKVPCFELEFVPDRGVFDFLSAQHLVY